MNNKCKCGAILNDDIRPTLDGKVYCPVCSTVGFSYSELPPDQSHPLTQQPFPDGAPLRELGGPLSDEITKIVKVDGDLYVTLHESHKMEKVGDVMCIDKSDSITKKDAIKRIKDIHELREVSHLKPNLNNGMQTFVESSNSRVYQRIGAINELMAIFDIKEEELK